eukprot:CAMPEP_0203754550 /NCGR_PEP_ID=MMETSP0098-20131031/8140_1 /ASSEMBLY_ACC=CAM_ASM_000208 /TAXON_ID=96639 /ORGANISM=" , Strain NY0313808BC1" /LENGTH=224 /DNA_ID=CAMNT_0050645625 /DNA_START=395 /DNA_END=1069 /DNA_ORIENTATION=+
MGTATDLFRKEGIRGFYRGGLPILVGGTMFRSAQFGVYSNVLSLEHAYFGKKERVFGIFDYQVAIAGFFGGIGRGLIEGPFDFIKIRRQVDKPWKFSEIYKGTGLTVLRNSGLFCSFSIYLDFTKQLFPNGELGPFLTGAISANLAWMTIWPLDVLKSRRQSGMYAGKSSVSLMVDIVKSGKLYRGILPGLVRSSFANGSSMAVYSFIKQTLSERDGGTRLVNK